MKLPLQLLLLTATFVGTFAIAQQKNSPATQFIYLLNQYDRNGLDLLTTDDFTLKESYVNHTWIKQAFLDSFVPQSKTIHGIFTIKKIQKISKTTTTLIVIDKSDYISYLKPGPGMEWKLTVVSENNKVKKIIADTTVGFKDFMEDFTRKRESFSAWMREKYPAETLDQNFLGDTIEMRLKEFSNRQK